MLRSAQHDMLPEAMCHLFGLHNTRRECSPVARSILAVIAGYLVMAGGIGAIAAALRIVLLGIYPEPGKAPSLGFMVQG